MSDQFSVTRWIDQLQADDDRVREDAVRKIWQHYSAPLLRMARARLSDGVRRREDEEDVLQSMFKSFSLRQQRGQFELTGRDDLWTVLVMLTMRKVCNTIKRQSAQRRDQARELSLPAGAGDEGDSGAMFMERLADDEAPPEEVAIVSEEMQRRLELLPDELQRIAFWKLDGYTNEEIAGPELLDCAVRTVERKLARIRQVWERADDGNADPE